MAGGVMLERGAEVAALQAAVSGAVSGASGFVVVSGAAGVGKTRLLEYTRRFAGEAGLRVLAGRASELERDYAFGLVRQVFEPVLVSASEGERAEWLAGAAGPAGALLGAGAGEPVPGEFAALHGLFWLTANLAQSGPVALVLDDLHWADEPSLRFLAFLLPRLEELPLLLVAAARPAEPGAPTHLLDVICSDPGCQLLRPAPLSAAAVPALVTEVLGRAPEQAFAQACHNATGGNPLLLTELTRALRTEQVAPTAANTPTVLQIGAHAVTRRVSLQLHRLDPDSARVVEAMAVLGANAEPANVAGLTRLAADKADRAVVELESAHLIQRLGGDLFRAPYEFEHPVVRAAIYDQIPATRRSEYHAAAARMLTEASARPEQIAAHILRLPPAANPDTVAMLRRAAAESLTRGAPEAALTYLRRALAEPPPEQDRLAVLTEAGLAAARVDLPTAADLLTEASAETDDPLIRGQLASVLGLALLVLQRADEAVKVLTDAIAQLPPSEDDLRRTLEATIIDVPKMAVGWDHVLERLPALRQLPPADSLGASMLDGMIAVVDTFAGDPGTLDRARRAVADPAMRKAASEGSVVAALGCWALLVGDPDEGIAAYDGVISEARRSGSLATAVFWHAHRGLGWLRRGDLSEAEIDLRESKRLQEVTGLTFARPIVSGYLAEILVEQGDTEQAEAILRWAGVPDVLPDVGAFFFFLQAKARVLRALGRFDQALVAAVAAGERFAAHGAQNPAVVAWRSEAALCLHALGRTTEAREYATEEIELARRWGAPYAHGRALRVAGLLTPGPTGLDLLREAVEILRPSTARLEHAKALVDLGAALRRSNARTEARPHLAAGLQLAYRCGASPLVDHARTELQAAGGRPRRPELTGPQSLTPSERRIAELATRGLTNRDIAQHLFVTTKTVEVHLSSVYRKLSINRRTELPAKLNTTTTNGA